MALDRRTILTFLLLLACVLIMLAVSLLTGSVDLAWAELLRGDTMARNLVLELRLPRALTALAAGGVLAIAGVLMQVLLRNPLADPFVMGVSGGAAVGALSGIAIGLVGLAVDFAAMLGALASTLLVFALAHEREHWVSHRLLLTGVVIAAGAGAIVSMLLALSDESHLRGMLFWLMGDLSLSPAPDRLLIVLAIALVVSVPFARTLNVLSHGDMQARALGLDTGKARIGVFVATSVLTGAAVSAAGTIGFVGLLTPHLVRLVLGSDHRRVVPAAALLGGVIVMAADLIARTAFAPRQLPVGAVTAVVGVPLFLLLMRRGSGTRQ